MVIRVGAKDMQDEKRHCLVHFDMSNTVREEQNLQKKAIRTIDRGSPDLPEKMNSEIDQCYTVELRWTEIGPETSLLCADQPHLCLSQSSSIRSSIACPKLSSNRP